MAKTGKKSKDTIEISKRGLFLVIFLVVIAIAVGIAVPATIHLKRKSINDGPVRPVKPDDSSYIDKQVGENGVFYGVFAEDEDGDQYHLMERDEYTTSKCMSREGNNENATSKCITYIPTFYGYEEDYNGQIITNVSEFTEIFGRQDPNYDAKFFSKKNLISVVTHMDYCGGTIDRVYIPGTNGKVAPITVDIHATCGPCPDEASIYLIAYENSYDFKEVEEPEYNDIADLYCDPDVSYKPVIYLYPTETTNVDVKLGAPEKLLVSYPKYKEAWRVVANPDGSLVDRETGRGLYSLYYESDNTVSKGVRDEGFVVKGADTAKFLEEKLAKLGLNDHEAEEFIIYWLPKLEANAYNYIYFELTDEVAENMPLTVSPAPETVIRFNMEYKALEAPIKVKTQKLPETPIRKGFTLVEWGGTIL
jgi:hypothetical protein